MFSIVLLAFFFVSATALRQQGLAQPRLRLQADLEIL